MHDGAERPTGSREPFSAALLAVAVAVAIVPVLLASRHGLGMSPDSVHYLTMARAIAGGALPAVTVSPPGLPALIAPLLALGLPLNSAALAINIVGVSAVVLLAGVLLWRHVRSRLLRTTALLAIAASPVLMQVDTYVWTEILFMALVLGCLVALEDFLLAPETDWRALAFIVVLTWLGFLLRYAGVVLIVVAGGCSLLRASTQSIVRRVGRAAALVGACLAVPLLLFARNWSVDGTLMGVRTASTGFSPVMRAAASAIALWFAPVSHYPWPISTVLRDSGGVHAILLSIGLLISATVLVWIGFVVLSRDVGTGRPRDLSLIPLGLFVATYIAYLVAAGSTTAIDLPNNRLLSPVYVPMLVLIASGIDALIGSEPSGRRRLATLFVAPVIALGVLSNGLESARTLAIVFADGQQYSSRAWKHSETLRAALRLPANVLVVSNNPDALSLFGREDTISSPSRTAGPNSAVHVENQEVGRMADLVARSGCECYLVWFDSGRTDCMLAPDEIITRTDLREVDRKEHSDGVIYRLRSSSSR